MISSKLEDAINEQINAEIYSAYLYQSMAAYFEAISLGGFANWMDVQAEEELTHARKFYDYLNERGGRVILDSIDAPDVEWEAPIEAFKDAYNHEQKVTAMINDLVDLAIKENDHATKSFLQWFVDEQVEEEASVEEIIDKMNMIGESGNGLYMFDNKLGERAFVDETQED
ncbi:MAG: ferritin [archaeon]